MALGRLSFSRMNLGSLTLMRVSPAPLCLRPLTAMMSPANTSVTGTYLSALTRYKNWILSQTFLVVFRRDVDLCRVPEQTRTQLRGPFSVSQMFLKMQPQNFSVLRGFLTSLGFQRQAIGGIYVGEGKQLMMASSRGWTPLYLKAVPIRSPHVLLMYLGSERTLLMASCRALGLIAVPLRQRSASFSSKPATLSMSSSLAFKYLLQLGSSLLTGFSCTSCPLYPSNSIVVIFTKSITPLKCSSSPRGYCSTKGQAFSLSFIDLQVRSREAPSLSILFVKHSFGRLRSFAWVHTFSVWVCTPLTASKIVTTPSKTLTLLATSPEKSTWPGVSMTLIWQPFQPKLMAADRIVIPLALSCGRQSIVVFPSSTFPGSIKAPAQYNILSVVVVFPASICAMMAMFLMLSNSSEVFSVSTSPSFLSLISLSFLILSLTEEKRPLSLSPTLRIFIPKKLQVIMKWDTHSIFWIGISYCLLTSFILRKSVFTLPALIALGYLLALATPTDDVVHGITQPLSVIIKALVFLFPICVMNNAMNVKRYIFRRSILPSLLLASLSYFLSISILTLLLSMFLEEDFDVLNYACIASVILVTDSFALQNIIHRLPQKLLFQNVIQGQAILKVCFGLSFFRLFNRLRNQLPQLHSTLFLLRFCFQFLGGLGVAICVFYLFNKLKVWLLESQVMFEMCLMLVCFFLCEETWNLNGMVSVVGFSILMRFQYRSGEVEIDRVRYINLFSEFIIATLCIISGYLFYFQHSLTLEGITNLLLMYILQTIVRAISVLLTVFLFKNTRFAVSKSQIFVSVFGSMKGVNNLLLMFLALGELESEELAGELIVKVVYLIVINNLISSLIIWRFEKLKPESSFAMIENKRSLKDVLLFMQQQIQQKQGNDSRLCQLTGYNHLQSLAHLASSPKEVDLRISAESLKQSLIIEECFIQIRVEVIQEFKKQIEKFRVTFPKEYNILRDFGEMEQQHPETQLQLFRELELTFLPLGLLKSIYKGQRIFVFSEMFRMVVLEMEFILNLITLYTETLEDICLMLNLSSHIHEHYRKKIVEELRDEIEAAKHYVMAVYRTMPNLLYQLKPMRDGRTIILSTKKMVLDLERDGKINGLTKEEYEMFLRFHDAKITNAGLGLETVEVEKVIQRNWIFECLTREQVEEVIKDSKMVVLRQGKKVTITSIVVVLEGSLTKILNDQVEIWHTRGCIIGLFTVIPFFQQEEMPIWADTECKLLCLKSANVRKLCQEQPQFFRRICCFSIYPLIQANLEKARDLGFYPERYIIKMAKSANLIECKSNQVLSFKKGGYVLKGELISQENRTSYIKGTERFVVHCYIPPSKTRVICMRESLVLMFETDVPVEYFETKAF